jgi:hypothetical protein
MLALEHVLFLKAGVTVKWSIKISYWQETPAEGQVAMVSASSFSSGDAE